MPLLLKDRIFLLVVKGVAAACRIVSALLLPVMVTIWLELTLILFVV